MTRLRSAFARRLVPMEKHEQSAGVGLLRSLGCTVYVLGTARRTGDYQGTCQTPGISDVIAFLPAARGVLFWEVKSQRGAASDAQRELQALALACEERGCGVYHSLGPCDVLIAKLVGMGLLRADQMPHYRTEREAKR